MKKIIDIKFINFITEEDVELFRNFLPKEGREFLKGKITYEYDVHTTIKDLFVWLLSKIEPDLSTNDDFLLGKILGYCDNYREILYLYHNLEKYILTNAVDNTLFFQYQLCVGGTVQIDGLVKIWIHSRESCHAGYPHVHLSKPGSKENMISYSLGKMEPVSAQDKDRFFKTFTKNQRVEIEDLLTKYRDDLKEFYENIRNGGGSVSLEIDYKGKLYILH